MTTTPPPSSRPSSAAPSSGGLPPYGPPRDGKPVSFFVAIFLGLLLLVSGALNVLLLFVSVLGAGSALPSSLAEEDDMFYQLVTVGGDKGSADRILRIPVQGAIAELPMPLIGAAGGTVSQIRRSLALAARDDSIDAVLLDINSPGGGVTDSDEVWQLLRNFKNDHPDTPVLALFGDIAASGGYYIAAACDAIHARPTTVTGSIGVIMSSYNFAEAAKSIGIDEVVIKSSRTPFKDILSPMRPMTDEEREILTSIIDEMYDRFVDVVDQGRPGLDRQQVLAIANGSIYSAQQALANGLIDRISTGDEAIDWIKNRLGIDKATLVEMRRRPGLRELLFGFRAPAPPSLEQAAASLLQSTTGSRFLYFWLGGR